MVTAIKSLKKEAKDNNFKHKKIIKTKDDTIEKLLEYKIMKTSQEKGFKNKTKKLAKKLKAVEERETNLKLAEVNLDPIQKKVDFNDNEASQEITEMETVETSTVVLPSVPV